MGLEENEGGGSWGRREETVTLPNLPALLVPILP